MKMTICMLGQRPARYCQDTKTDTNTWFRENVKQAKKTP